MHIKPIKCCYIYCRNTFFKLSSCKCKKKKKHTTDNYFITFVSVAKPLTLTCLSAAQSESAGFTGFPLPQAGQRRCRLHILILQSLFLHPSIPQRPVYSPGLWPCHLRDSPDHQAPGDWLGLVIDSPRHRNNKERCCSVRGSDAVSHSVVGIFLYYRPVCRLKIQLTEVCPLH